VFYDPAAFAFTPVLEKNWQTAFQEYLGVRRALVDWSEKELYGEGWQVFALFDFPHGRCVQENVRRCPLTAALVESNFPRHGAAGFSVLRPHTRIEPHRGYQGDFLRCHLGLKVPNGDCALSVEGQTRNWQQGRAIVFDDRLLHEAWNWTDEDRVILLIDFVPEFASRPS
jgi:aspartyl/asparaginyl beta-hydroxylase (cupin superfamily)